MTLQEYSSPRKNQLAKINPPEGYLFAKLHHDAIIISDDLPKLQQSNIPDEPHSRIATARKAEGEDWLHSVQYRISIARCAIELDVRRRDKVPQPCRIAQRLPIRIR